ncbi:unknown [Eubacterium sp. CAG:786]|nr:unknown [Eubacterium sp. CAG:786]
MEVIASLLSQLLEKLIVEYAKYYIRKQIDSIGNSFTQIVQYFDDDGDGETDREVVLAQFDVSVPDLSDDYCIVNKGDEIGLGLPKLEPFTADDIGSMIDDEVFTGNSKGVYIGDDVYVPIPVDFDNDGSTDWGRVVDSDDNGVPDASPDAPFFPVGSDGYNQILSEMGDGDGVDIVLVSPEGEIAVYDRNGNIKEEDVDTAYATWVSQNGIMDKKLDNYSVTEGLLLCVLLISVAFFIRSLFKRKDVFR